MIVYYRFIDVEDKTTVEHYLCCVKVRVSATAQSTFDKLNEFLEEHVSQLLPTKQQQCKVLQMELCKK